MLHSTGINSEHTDLFLCFVFTQRPMNIQKIEQSNAPKKQVLANSLKKNLLSLSNMYKALKPFWLLNKVIITRMAEHVSSSEPVEASSDCSPQGNTLCLCSSVQASNLCLRVPPRALLLILHSKPLIVFWNNLREWLPEDRQGFKLGLELELYHLTNKL